MRESDFQTTVKLAVARAESALSEAGVFFGHGTDNAWDEAAWLVARACGLPPTLEPADWERTLDAASAARAAAWLSERIERRVPLAYVIGEAWFCGLPFEVDESVLVPRSPIAELIDSGFEPWVVSGRVHRILDLGTGSGCLAVAMAKVFPEASVDAVDRSTAALELVRRNAERHDVSERVRPVASYGFGALAGSRYDLIVSNPPYVPERRATELPEEYRAEPGMALYSGRDGLDLPLQWLAEAPDYLASHGVLVMEVGEAQGALAASLPEAPLTWLEFEHGGEGVLLVEGAALDDVAAMARRETERRQHVE